jgi:hypothetical protein
LADDAVVMSTVISASPSEIVIERDGFRWRMTPAAPRFPARTSRFPGSEWILGARLKERAPVGF